jgi:hypothetical protein
MTLRDATSTWMGDYELKKGTAGLWRIGPLSFRVEHLASEWRVYYSRASDPLDTALEVRVPVSASHSTPLEDVDRFALANAESKLVIGAALADRPIVTRPETPFFVPPSQSVTLYVTVPLWVRIAVGNEGTQLVELPTYRLSDSWFGPPTSEGELCYASRTVCRLELAEVPLRPHRALTTVRLTNRSDKPLGLVRLKLPAPRLELYQDSGGRLWTQDVAFERREEHEEFAALHLRSGPPKVAPDAHLLASPRDSGPELDWSRAFSVLFSRRARQGN